MITRDLARDLESIERDAWLDMFRAAPNSYVEASGSNFKRLNDAVGLADRGVPITEFNRVFSLGLEKPASLNALDNAVAWLGSNAASGWAIQLSPLAIPHALYDWLRGHGLERSGTGWAKFYRPASELKMKPRASSLEIRRIDKTLAHDFARVVQSGFGLPEPTAEWFAALVERIKAGMRIWPFTAHSRWRLALCTRRVSGHGSELMPRWRMREARVPKARLSNGG